MRTVLIHEQNDGEYFEKMIVESEEKPKFLDEYTMIVNNTAIRFNERTYIYEDFVESNYEWWNRWKNSYGWSDDTND